MDFSVGYLDVSFIPTFKIIDTNIKVNIGAGPMLSVQLVDKTDYNIKIRKELDGGSYLVEHDFYYQGDGPTSTMPYLGYGVQIGFEYHHFTSVLRMNRSFGFTHQIYPLEESMRMGTVQVLAGYYF